MKFKTRVLHFVENPLLYGPYILIPNDIYQAMILLAPDKRVKCVFNHELEHYCAMLPNKEIGNYILFNQTILKKLNLNFGDEIDVDILAQDLEYGIPISEEMQEVLNSDYEGNEYFQALTKGAQRSLIHVINKFKNPQLKIDRSIIILQHLVLRKGKLDFKILQENFREGI